MNYALIIKGRFDGSVIAEVNKIVELASTLKGLTLEELSFKPLDQPSILVERPRRAQTRTFSDDPKLVYKSVPRANGIGGSRIIDIAQTLIKLGINETQALNGNWKMGSPEQRVARAIRNRNLRLLKR